MLGDTKQEKQAMLSSNDHWKAGPNHDAGAGLLGDKTTMKERTTVDGRIDIVVEDGQVNSSTATTVSSESKQTGNSSNVHTSSCVAEEETDPTSSPSEIFDEPDRKCTESPIDSDRAVYGSNSVHSESSESSTEQYDSKKITTASVDPDKVEAIGGQFDESCDGREAVSFHNPVNDIEAQHINDKVKRTNTTMENIDLRPEVHFRDPGSSFQVSARPEESTTPKPPLDADGDIVPKPKVQFAPEPLLHFERGEENCIERPRRRYSACCIIL